MAKLVLGGGCFWGLEELFRALDGVTDTEVGYAGGQNDNPTYDNHPGHVEALEVTYDESTITVDQLLDFFFTVHDPTTKDRQGNDVGSSYRSVIFYDGQNQKRAAENMIRIVDYSGAWENPVVTALEPLDKFYPAESYHQDYLQKNPTGYTCHYRRRDSYLS